MTERKQLKKKLKELKRFKSNLPRLISCSTVYGDTVFTEEDLLRVDKDIKRLNRKIEKIDSDHKTMLKSKEDNYEV